MAPDKFNDNNPSTSNTRGHGDGASDTNAQDQILLKALQEFLVPLVQTVVEPTGTKAVDFKGPEAMNLITALKKFVSTIVGGTVRVEETPRKIQIEKYATRNHNAGDIISSLSRTPRNQYAIRNEMFREKLMNELQEHVSNKMPIRLLLIEPHAFYLQISLIERGAIYAHLADIVKALPVPFNSTYHSQHIMDNELIESTIKSYARYAILSHKWLRGTPGEITYDHWNKGLLDPESAGYQKLAGFCSTAWKDYGITLAWMDTVCINKDSSSELDESIRSMYAWYERADICIVYLSETQTIPQIMDDTWFTRGWTLQELLAPKALKFYSMKWTRLAQDWPNDKTNLEILYFVEYATKITPFELKHDTSNFRVSMSRGMQWAASRKVTREEDMAYALMGIFNVSISIAYGEGADRAFLRLLEEIIKTAPSGALDLFNWAGESNRRTFNTSLLPSSPKYYIS
ncbi:hypothetical protein BDN70DRAFT_921104 [Pholiota conissans]|uniref:Heterokaryon incompatibility domain-containing protein n=1 Tax=Pholiota conissans TaxID=109636 RepID=A0A9P6CTR8_9AGAR|nr:hypothetical protein BDN70DRAFT_921104 [Pholiota conissans]